MLQSGIRQHAVQHAAEEGAAQLAAQASTAASASASLLPLPPCKQHHMLSSFAEEASSWCDPLKVPAGKRAPAKLQGLFWLSGLPLPDVAACFSRGVWDKEERTLRVNVWSDFVFKDTTASEAFESLIFKADMHYLVRFSDDSLSNATIHPQGSGRLFNPVMGAFDVVSDFPMVEEKTESPGERWHRPSYFGIGSNKALANSYTLVRVLDGGLSVIQKNADAMVGDLDPTGQGLRLSRFSVDCLAPESCDRDSGGTCRFSGCSMGEADCVKRSYFRRQCICREGYCAVNGKCLRVG